MKIKFLKEVDTDRQRRYMCHMKGDKAKRPKGLSQDEAGEMCTGPKKEEQLEEISTSAAVAGAPGASGGPWATEASAIRRGNEEEKKQSELKGTPLEEMYSSSALQPGGDQLPEDDKENEGRLEREEYLKSIRENKLGFHKRWKKFLKG